jgi:hypothetical protein
MKRCLRALIRGVIASIATFSCVFTAPLAANALVPDGGQSNAPAVRPKYTPLERMAPERLKATHEDLERIGKTRRVLPALPGMNDYRAILHAHAEDSSHTGGTRPEMLAEAKKAGVQAIFLSDHHRPPRDFIRDSWRGLREGVLFVPGSEANGFLLYPAHSIMEHMNGPTRALIEATRSDGGLIFLSHIEERPGHSMDGLDGMEIFNRHFDAKNDTAGLLAIMLKLTAPASLRDLENSLMLFPDELFAAQVEYPAAYLAKWDAETKTHRLTGVAANDCHHNFVLLVKMVDENTVKLGTNVDSDDQMRSFSAKLRPGIGELTKGRKKGDILARLDLDPYSRSFKNVSTHILAPELSEAALRAALRGGRAYVSHDWMCDPTGFRFELLVGSDSSPNLASTRTKRVAFMGDSLDFTKELELLAQFPVPCRIRLLKSGTLVAEGSGDHMEYAVPGPGVYRVEGWLECGGESRGWVYSNPIYAR